MNEFQKALNSALMVKMLEKGHGETASELGALGSSLRVDLFEAVTGRRAPQQMGDLGSFMQKAQRKKIMPKTSARFLRTAVPVKKAPVKTAVPAKVQTPAKVTTPIPAAVKPTAADLKKKAEVEAFFRANIKAMQEGRPYFTKEGVVDPAKPNQAPVDLRPLKAAVDSAKARGIDVPLVALQQMAPAPVTATPITDYATSEPIPPGLPWVPDTATQTGDEYDYSGFDFPTVEYAQDEQAPMFDIEQGDYYTEQPQFETQESGFEPFNPFDQYGEDIYTAPQDTPDDWSEFAPSFGYDDPYGTFYGVGGLDGFFSKVSKKIKNAGKKVVKVITTPHKKLMKAVGIKTPPGIKKIEREVKRVGRQIDKNKGVVVGAAAVIYGGMVLGPKIGAALMKAGGVSKAAVASAAAKMGVGSGAVQAITSAAPSAADVTAATELATNDGFWSKIGGVAAKTLNVAGDLVPLVKAGVEIDAVKFQQKMALAEQKAAMGQDWGAVTSWEQDYNAPGFGQQQIARNAQTSGGDAAKLLIPAAAAALTLLM